jgi:beta-mannanase
MSRTLTAVSIVSLFLAGLAAAVALAPSASAKAACPGKSGCHGKATTTTTTDSTTTQQSTTQQTTTQPATTQTTTTAQTTTTVPTTTTATTTATTTTATTTTATTTTAATTTTSSAPKSIYWGALMDGNNTYGSSYGDAPWDANTWGTFQSHAGKKASIVHWGVPAPWTSSFNTQLTAHTNVLTAGELSLLDMNSGSTPLADIAAGKYDSSITTWAQQAAAFKHPFFLRWDWEMNGSWFSWGTTSSNQNTAAAYVSAWRRMHDIFVKNGATNVTWVWCPNTVFSGSTSLASLYPGDSYVDWTCLDSYNKGGSGWMSFANLIGPTYDQLQKLAPGKPVMIGETSSSENGGSKASWIQSALSSLPSAFPQVRAFLWFNWKITESGTTWDWPIESSSSAQSAFASGIASNYFQAGGGLGSLPLLAPIRPLQ